MQFSNSAPGDMWPLTSLQLVFVQQEAEGIGIWCKSTQTLRYAMSHGLCKAMDSDESEHTNTYFDDWKGKVCFELILNNSANW